MKKRGGRFGRFKGLSGALRSEFRGASPLVVRTLNGLTLVRAASHFLMCTYVQYPYYAKLSS